MKKKYYGINGQNLFLKKYCDFGFYSGFSTTKIPTKLESPKILILMKTPVQIFLKQKFFPVILIWPDPHYMFFLLIFSFFRQIIYFTIAPVKLHWQKEIDLFGFVTET